MLRHIAVVVRNSRGQSMVEFALVLPLLLILVLGIINFGMIGYNVFLVNEAAREGARAAAVSGDAASALAAVTAVNNTFATDVKMPTAAGASITVKVTGKVNIVDPVYSYFFQPNPYPVNGRATMRLEVAPVSGSMNSGGSGGSQNH